MTECLVLWSSQVVLVAKSPPSNAGDIRDAGSIPGLGRSPGGGHGNLLPYSCLENPMDRGDWQAAVHGSKELNMNEVKCTPCIMLQVIVLIKALVKSDILKLKWYLTEIKHCWLWTCNKNHQESIVSCSPCSHLFSNFWFSWYVYSIASLCKRNLSSCHQ